MPATPTPEMRPGALGLWSFDVASGETFLALAPFSIKAELARESRATWVAWGVEDGELVLSLGISQSHDHAYRFFGYDGSRWRQPLPPIDGQAFVYGRHARFKVWTERRKITTKGVLLTGGDLTAMGGPLTFAVDNTHAFAHDSGPDSLEAPDYARLKAEARALDEGYDSGLDSSNAASAHGAPTRCRAGMSFAPAFDVLEHSGIATALPAKHGALDKARRDDFWLANDETGVVVVERPQDRPILEVLYLS